MKLYKHIKQYIGLFINCVKALAEIVRKNNIVESSKKIRQKRILPDARHWRQRMENIIYIKMPEKHFSPGQLPRTLINVFPFIFRNQFGWKIPDRADRSWFFNDKGRHIELYEYKPSSSWQF